MTPKQLRFCEEYLLDLNATQAAIRAGHSPRSAASIGWENLRKPEIKEYLAAALDERSLSAPETLKSISDIARANINDYFKIVQRVHTPKLRVPLAEYIEMKKDELEKAQYLHDIALAEGLLGKGDTLQLNIQSHNDRVLSLRYNIVALEVEYANKPDGYRIINGPDELVEEVDIDLVRLTKDKAAGRIKSFAMTPYGPKVELYPADAALRDLAKVHGLYEKDNKQQGIHVNVSVTPEEVASISAALNKEV